MFGKTVPRVFLKRWIFIASALWSWSSGVSAVISQEPLYLVQEAKPLVMLAVSVDHQLFKKAYPDYSDLDADGVLDTSYTDSFNYYGYFDSSKCYTYDSTDGRFEPTATTPSGANSHHCGTTEWSGNFLNWASMTRIDILRKVLYGGKRSTDTATTTVLERSLVPTDVHAFAKVFTASSGAEMQKYTPYNKTTISMCNVTNQSDGSRTTGDSESVNTTNNPPRLLIADGSYPRWASDEAEQCRWGTGQNAPQSANLFTANTDDGPNVRVQVCVSGNVESNCQEYAGGGKKPSGLLQEYGEDGTLRFGMISGSYAKRDHGGVLRRYASKLAGNTTASDNEINADGTFTGNAGIISTLNKIRINEWDFSSPDYNDCDEPGISKSDYLTSSSSNKQCTNWGNPISEIYLESLRYLAGESSATTTYATSSDPLGLVQKTWSASTDPMPSDEWCSAMNVVLISSSDNSFDTDNLTNLGSLIDYTSRTNEVGAAEGYSGNVFIGDNGTTADDECTAKPFTNLSALKGICPTAPSLEGGYHVAGLAYGAHITDMRPDRNNDPVTGKAQTVDSFVVALSKELPEFSFPVGSGTIKIIPTFGAHSTGSSSLATSGWRTGSLANITVTEVVYAGGNLTYARFLAQWEDSPWGNDYDKDGIAQLAICVGAECANHDDDTSGTNDSALAAGQLRVTNRVVNANAGHALRFGFVVSGSTADGHYSEILRPGGKTGDGLDSDNNPNVVVGHADWTHPIALTFSPGATAATLLDNPLVLAAKYGGFEDSDSSADSGYQLPDKSSEWDTDGDGLPDNYFLADNPALLGAKLSSFLSSIATESSSSSVVANSGTIDTGTKLYMARFDSSNWSGQLLSLPINPATGVAADPTAAVNASDIAAPDWDSGIQITAQNWSTGREIITSDGSDNGRKFRLGTGGLTALQQTALDLNPTTLVADGLAQDRLNYLRGNTAKEIRNSGGVFRNRGYTDSGGSFHAQILGDVVHSSPVLVQEPASGHLDSIEATSYSGFVSTNASRAGMVYFGANDGMLHAIDEATGNEKFAYIPNALFAQLNKLTATNYSHRYYVDGGITVVDAFFSSGSGSAWHTVLAGALGAGGKAVFALDVTNPATFDEDNADDIVLWEKDDTDLPELGYTFSQPTIFKAEGDGWVVAFGNGYDSASGHAVLYLVDMNGVLLKTLTLENSAGNNGLSSISPVDSDFDGEVDRIYAGDLQGNVWRLKAGNSGFSTSGQSKELLFTAKASASTRQPITTRIEVGVHPQGKTGRVVYFGTGKYYETTDDDPSTAVSPNTMYAVYDDDSSSPTVGSITNHAISGSLLKQTITEHTGTLISGTGDTIDFELRTVTDTQLDWDTYDGWFIDLPTTGEKMVVDPVLRGGRVIFTTTIPSSSPCEYGGTSWLMEVSSENGGTMDAPVFDLNNDGVFDLADYLDHDNDSDTAAIIASGKKSKSGILQTPAILIDKQGKKEYKYSSGSKGGVIERTTENPVPFDKGRKSWLQLK